MKRVFLFLLLAGISLGLPVRTVCAQSRVDTLLADMSLEERIAQLLIVRVSSTGSEADIRKSVDNIAKYRPGGVCFFKGTPLREASVTNRMQAASKIPLIVSIDGEWGIAMRLDSCVSFPRQMTMGALSPKNDSLIYRMGLEVAAQCRAIGVNLNFAPCVDINNNARNPVINSRSFGENRERVTEKAALYLKGMQDGGITGCIKHFPGHGDTETDSHIGLPTIKKSRIELDEMELYPFRNLISSQEVDMVMVGHLNVPALDSADGSVSSLSFATVSELLEREYGYTGLVVTDGLEMQGVRRQARGDGEAEVRALLAGVDLLLLPGTTETVVQTIKKSVLEGLIPEELINERCRRVLQFKEDKGILDYAPVDLQKVSAKVNAPHAVHVCQEIERKAVTLLKNEHNTLPLVRGTNDTLAADSIVLLCVGREEYQSEYRKLADMYGLVYRYIPGKKEKDISSCLTAAVEPYNRVIVAYGASNQLASRQYGVDTGIVSMLNSLSHSKRTVMLHLGNPYALDYFGTAGNYEALLVTYQSTPNSVQAALQVCFGQRDAEGLLPVSNNEYPSGAGIVPEEYNENFSALPDSITARLDTMFSGACRNHIFPGCEVVALHDGNVLYRKCFGYYTYDRQDKVTMQTMYDVASLTKVAATTLAVMKLYDEKRIRLSDAASKYLPYLHGTDKAHITISELLTHTSGLPAFIPFYKDIQGNESFLRRYKTPTFDVKVADNLYLRNDYPDTMRQRIAECRLGHRQYVYSDLNFLLLKEIVEKITEMPMDVYLDENFYSRMGLARTSFNPLSHGYSKSDIAPTEKDTSFRQQVVQGYVHDQTAALFYGNAGNAGLFTTADDMAAIFEMLLNGGTYNGQRYLSGETVKLFTSAHEQHGCKVRGLGFYTPKHRGNSSIVPADAGSRIFGHQGFTGTVAWCDPDSRLVFVFLSNRVYPDCYPNRLAKSRIRLLSHELIYEAINNDNH